MDKASESAAIHLFMTSAFGQLNCKALKPSSAHIPFEKVSWNVYFSSFFKST